MASVCPPVTFTYLETVRDPRRREPRHKLTDLLAMAVCGFIAGCETWVDIELFGKAKRDGWRRFWNCRMASRRMILSDGYSPCWTRRNWSGCCGVLCKRCCHR